MILEAVKDCYCGNIARRSLPLKKSFVAGAILLFYTGKSPALGNVFLTIDDCMELV
jgi:hypothetical protein